MRTKTVYMQPWVTKTKIPLNTKTLIHKFVVRFDEILLDMEMGKSFKQSFQVALQFPVESLSTVNSRKFRPPIELLRIYSRLKWVEAGILIAAAKALEGVLLKPWMRLTVLISMGKASIMTKINYKLTVDFKKISAQKISTVMPV